MPKIFASRSQIMQLYCIDRLSALEASKRLNMSHTTLMRYLDRFGIPKRGRSEAKQGVKLSPAHREKVIRNLRQFNTK